MRSCLSFSEPFFLVLVSETGMPDHVCLYELACSALERRFIQFIQLFVADTSFTSRESKVL